MKRILFLSNHFITLYNFRKELISRLITDGHEVYISIPRDDRNVYFSNLGCKVIETNVDRRGINPVLDIKLIHSYLKIMKSVRPDIIFSYTVKPNIYGSIASNIIGIKQVNNITGTGATFIKDTLLSKGVRLLYKFSVKYSYKVLFQNSGDMEYFLSKGMVRNNYELIPGSGVNLNQFEFCELPTGSEKNFIFIGRVMKIKGIDEYLEMAKHIKNEYCNANFYVAGYIEEENYRETLDLLNSKGIIKYLGFQNDVKKWIRNTHCTVLPSHGGEGIPNVLLESCAMGRICIASNIAGSRDVVNDDNGLIFEAGNTDELINKVKLVLEMDDEKMESISKKSRLYISKKFDRNIVVNKYIDILGDLPGGVEQYDEVL